MNDICSKSDRFFTYSSSPSNLLFEKSLNINEKKITLTFLAMAIHTVVRTISK